jgi:hypothetical protein
MSLEEMFEYTKGVIRSCTHKKRQTLQWSTVKGQKDKPWSIKHCTGNNEKHEPGFDSCDTGGYAVPALLVTPVVLLINTTDSM